MSCRTFCRSSSRLIPASTAQSHGVGLHSGCSQSHSYVVLLLYLWVIFGLGVVAGGCQGRGVRGR
jgi:hypothetical protein